MAKDQVRFWLSVVVLIGFSFLLGQAIAAAAAAMVGAYLAYRRTLVPGRDYYRVGGPMGGSAA